jgi:hypothetical protein
MRCAWLFVLLWLLPACGSNLYGYARTYQPLGDENPHYRDAVPLEWDEVRRFPDRYADDVVGWFGVVRGIEVLDDNRVRVTAEYRTHQERHLCRDAGEDSCRVTVSASSPGNFTAELDLIERDRTGPDRLGPGSLVRVYGTPTAAESDATGPILQTRYYRQWPVRRYVTTAAAGAMRQ